MAFDLLYVDGHSLLDETYDERRSRLESLQLAGATFTTTESFRDVVGRDILAAAVANGLEGVVAKRRSSPYRPGRRSPEWVKVKSFRTQEVVIGGWTEGKGGATAASVPCCSACPRTTASLRGQGGHRVQRDAAVAPSWTSSGRSRPHQPLRRATPGRETRGAHFVRPEPGR